MSTLLRVQTYAHDTLLEERMKSMLPDEQYFSQDFSEEAVLLENIRRNLVDAAIAVVIPANLKFQFDPEISQVYITLFQAGTKLLRWGSRKKNTI